MLILATFEAELVQALNVDGAVFGGHSNPSLKKVDARTKEGCKLTNATVTSRTTIRNAKALF